MHEDKKVELQTRLNREDVSGIFEALSEGLKEGILKVNKSGETLDLPVPCYVDLDIVASYSETRASFALDISWRPNKASVTDYPSEECSKSKPLKDTESELAEKLEAIEDSLRTTAHAVKDAARIASKKASVALTKVAASTIGTLEIVADKTRKTVAEIRDEAERLAEARKNGKQSAYAEEEKENKDFVDANEHETHLAPEKALANEGKDIMSPKKSSPKAKKPSSKLAEKASASKSTVKSGKKTEKDNKKTDGE